MSEPERPSRDTGRRLAYALSKVLAAGTRGSSLADIDGSDIRAAPPTQPPAEPAERYAEDHARFVRTHLGFDADSPELGDWLAPTARGEDATGGTSAYVRFPEYWRSWMRQQGPDNLRALTVLAGMGTEGAAVLRGLARREMERRIIGRVWERARRWIVWAVGAAFVAAHFFADQAAWIVERAPVLREALRWLLGSWK